MMASPTALLQPMFCYQCEQTAHGTGCDVTGICGKTPDVANLQDLMVYICKGYGELATLMAAIGVVDAELNDHAQAMLFMTLTNVNFDRPEHLDVVFGMVKRLNALREAYYKLCEEKGVAPQRLSKASLYEGSKTAQGLLAFSHTISLQVRQAEFGATITGLEEMLTYGIKGLAAYAHHARLLGHSDPETMAFVHRAMGYMAKEASTVDELIGLCLESGKVNYRVMEVLDTAHTSTYGHPVPTQVRTTLEAGKSILISGHDMHAMEALLKQTEGKGINVYTHGEMLPAHSYPGLKKYSHLKGNYGTAWQNQVKEFAEFPGSILLTTNCLKPPADSYKGRLFTMDVVGFEGLTKCEGTDFTAVVDAVLNCDCVATEQEPHYITIGFGHNTVLSLAGPIVEAIQNRAIKNFFLIGGCDGHEHARNYFNEFAEAVPQDSMILTLGCGKYRFNMKDFGKIGDFPRLLDMGQCNDSYSAVQVALALAGAFKCGVNDLPLHFIVSWFEQKAVAVLLTLLHLGVQNIYLGPNLPAFITPDVLNVLVDTFKLKATSNAQDDLAACLARAEG